MVPIRNIAIVAFILIKYIKYDIATISVSFFRNKSIRYMTVLGIGTAYVLSTAKTGYSIYHTSTKFLIRRKSARRLKLRQCFYHQHSLHLSFGAPLLMILCQLSGTWKAQCPLTPYNSYWIGLCKIY